MPLVLRNVKQAKLTWTELDGNFTYLENKIDELEQLVNGDEVVKVTAQTFLPSEQNQVLENIGAVSIGAHLELELRVSDIEEWRTSLFDETFVFDSTTNPNQQFTLAFTPTQIESIFDTNTPIWMDQGDFAVAGNILTINYPLEENAIIKLKYFHLI